MKRLVMAGLGLALASGVLSGCGRDRAAAAPPPAPPAAAATPAVASVQVGKSIGADKRITSGGGTIGTRDTVYASVATTGTGSATLVANWTTADGTRVHSDTQTVNLSGPAVTEFHITRPRAWPAGRYHVEVLLNGQQAGRADYEIR